MQKTAQQSESPTWSGRSPASPNGPSKARAACLNCRRQKMKCRVDTGNSTCRRCLGSGSRCVFVPRTNAAVWKHECSPNHLPKTSSATSATPGPQKCPDEVFRRLDRLEQYVGLLAESEKGIITPSHSHETAQHTPPDSGDVEHTTANDMDRQDPFAADAYPQGEASAASLWPSIMALKSIRGLEVDSQVWELRLVEGLVQAFHEKLEGFHFLPQEHAFSSLSPLMLAVILYYTSVRGRSIECVHARDYFRILCSAISQFCIPDCEISRKPSDPFKVEEWAFQTVLAFILAGLLREGISMETGVWISIAYRLLLEHCPSHSEDSPFQWQKLFTGLQIVDLEHASVHLSCPVIPLVPPIACLRPSTRSHLYRLSQMMHTGLTHFTGRGLSTIWSCFSGEARSASAASGQHTLATAKRSKTEQFLFTNVDAVVVRDWARQLDEWLLEFSTSEDPQQQQAVQLESGENGSSAGRTSQNTRSLSKRSERRLIFRQYVLHRILVLSIYLPARGCDLFAGTTPKEQQELLLSARAAVKLQAMDDTIWANFDLLIITWAALIVIQGIAAGVSEPDDLDNVQIHLAKLQQVPKSDGNVHDTLVSHLAEKLRDLNATTIEVSQEFVGSCSSAGSNVDPSWYLFDVASLQSGYNVMMEQAW